MRKIKIIFIIGIFFVLPLFGEKIASFPQLSLPEYIEVGENLLCINKEAEVYLYNLKDLKLIRKIGGEGEGPGEFKPIGKGLNITILKDKIMIESKRKLSFFSLMGDLIKERLLLPKYSGLKILGDRYFATSWKVTNKVGRNVVIMLDDNFNELKSFYRNEAGYQKDKQSKNYACTWDYDVGENKFFVVGSSAFKIDVFDKNGDFLNTISMEYERVKLTQMFADAWFSRIKRRLGINAYQFMKRKVRFSDFFPAILDLIVNNDHIYVITYRREQNNSECFIFDLEGKLIKKTWLPLKNYDGVVLFPYSINNSYLYQMIDNEDTEECELHRFSIQ